MGEVRIYRTRLNYKNFTYTISSSRSFCEVEINRSLYKTIKKIKGNEGRINVNDEEKQLLETMAQLYMFHDIQSFISEINILSSRRVKYPMTAATFEITDGCNLKCVHCYGSFNYKETKTMNYEQIKQIVEEMDSLQTAKVALTGGEITLNKDLLRIMKLLFTSGYQVTLLTNGYDTESIIDMVDMFKEYCYVVKVSLDGINEVHNSIRGNNYSFERTLRTLDFLHTQSNIKLFISTAIMKENFQFIKELDDFVNLRYPNAIHTHDFVFPMGNAKNNHALSVAEINSLDFHTSRNENNSENSGENKELFRCSGGRSQCTIMCNGKIKTCNSACDECFVFKHNVYEVGIKKAWEDCGYNIKKYRKEKNHMSIDCKKCNLNKSCTVKDCRVLGHAYCGSVNRSNPIACWEARRDIMKEKRSNASVL